VFKKSKDNPDNPLKLEVKWVKSWFPHGFHGQILWFLPHGGPSFSWATAPMGTLGTTGTSPHKKMGISSWNIPIISLLSCYISVSYGNII
jgi:hypothetical protein